MHWVDRGPEPQGLAELRARRTRDWIRYYKQKRGRKPTDSHWLRFRDELSGKFCFLCGYCEEECKAEIDHFRPKSRNPELVYVWENWVYACHSCNHAKGDKWAGFGYVDPCAKTRSARPENYFDFDVVTGRIVPKNGLNVARHNKATNTIRDLGLNEFAHIKRRRYWLMFLAAIVEEVGVRKFKKSDLIAEISSRDAALSSLTRAYLGLDYV